MMSVGFSNPTVELTCTEVILQGNHKVALNGRGQRLAWSAPGVTNVEGRIVVSL